MSLAAPPRPPEPGARPPARLTAPPRAGSTAAAVVMAGLLAAMVWAFVDLGINVATFVDGAANAARFAQRVFPLDFPPLLEVLALCAQTLAIVVCATLLSVVLSVPLALLAAGNTTPGRGLRLGSRAVIVVARAVPDVVLAIVFVRVFGLGALPGVLAMGLHSIGMIGKLYADAVEQLPDGPATALRATGATRMQQIAGAVLPGALPAFVAVGLHRLDINLRISVILGFVGVAGIGKAIADALALLDYPRAIALALVVLVLCIVIESISGAIRGALLGRREERRGGVSGALVRLVRPVRPGAVVGRGTAAQVRPRGPGTDAELALDADVTRDPRLRSAAALVEGRTLPPWTPARIRRTAYVGVSAVAVLASMFGSGVSLAAFADVGGILTAIGYFVPPETGGILPELVAAMLDTISIALAATLIGIVLSLPLGSLAARNVAPTPGVAKAARLVILTIRGLPELILAIVFVVITGLGEVAGAFALGIASVGLLGKLVADSLEELDPGPEQAVRATGASRPQVFFSATVPAGAPAFVAHVLYLLDVNIRSATLLGIVGAGGIGFQLLNAARVLEFGVVTTIMMMVFATVMAVELLALWLRRAVR
ncbi:MAG: phosphonate ABC transporter, permease protein PhnE [Pseudonocardia sp.]